MPRVLKKFNYVWITKENIYAIIIQIVFTFNLIQIQQVRNLAYMVQNWHLSSLGHKLSILTVHIYNMSSTFKFGADYLLIYWI